MSLIISEVELNRLQEINENKNLISLEYLEDTGNKLTKFIYDNFFNGNSEDTLIRAEGLKKLKLLNQSFALPYKLTTVKSKYVGIPNTNLRINNLEEAIFSFVYGGSMIFAIDEIDEFGLPIVNIYNSEQYIREGNIHKLLTYLKDGDDKYVFVKTHENGTGKFLNELYLIKENINGLKGIKVPLSKLKDTKDFDEEEDFGTEENLIFVEHDLKIKNPKYGTPSLNFIKPLLRSLDIELVNIKDQFLKHLTAKLAIQGIDASQMPKDAEGNILMREAEAIFLQNGVNKPEYIQNKNDLLQEVMKMIDKYIAVCATNLSIPIELVGLNGQTGTESTESKLLRYSDFIKDIEYIRNKISKAFDGIYETIVDINEQYFDNDNYEDEFLCKWSEVMPRDSMKISQELSLAKTNGLISQETAVRQYLQIEGEELEEELNKIKNEQANSLDNFNLI